MKAGQISGGRADVIRPYKEGGRTTSHTNGRAGELSSWQAGEFSFALTDLAEPQRAGDFTYQRAGELSSWQAGGRAFILAGGRIFIRPYGIGL